MSTWPVWVAGDLLVKEARDNVHHREKEEQADIALQEAQAALDLTPTFTGRDFAAAEKHLAELAVCCVKLRDVEKIKKLTSAHKDGVARGYERVLQLFNSCVTLVISDSVRAVLDSMTQEALHCRRDSEWPSVRA